MSGQDKAASPAARDYTVSLSQEELTILLDIVATADNIGNIGERIYERLIAFDMRETQ